MNWMRNFGLIHRKDWEWAIGILAMKRFNKLNNNNLAIGVGSAELNQFHSIWLTK